MSTANLIYWLAFVCLAFLVGYGVGAISATGTALNDAEAKSEREKVEI